MVTSRRPGDAVTSAKPQVRLSMLDGLRLLAAVAVVLFHYTARPSNAWGGADALHVFPNLSWLTRYGYLGVDLFFIISGFVILMTAWGRDLPGFAASRVARIFPAYWFAVLFTGALLLLAGAELGKKVTLQQIIVNLTMVHKAFDVSHVDGVYWTLWVELRFYLIIAVFLFVGITRNRVLAFTTIWPIVGAIAASADSEFIASILIAAWAPYFALGMLLFLVHREGWSPLLGLLILFQTALAMGQAASYSDKMARLVDAPIKPLIAAAVVLFCAMVVAVLTTTKASGVQARLLTNLGALTYPLYLIHEYWGWFLISRIRGALPPAITVVIVLAMVLLLSYLLHLTIERPLAARLRTAVKAGLSRAHVEGMDQEQQQNGEWPHTARGQWQNAPREAPAPSATPGGPGH